MTVQEALKSARERLRDVPEPKLDAECLLSHVMNIGRLDLLMDKGRALTNGEAAEFERLVALRQTRQPLQYILGSQSFMGFPFKTDARALIPRFDTEALCVEALRHIRPGSRVLDLCTGTGCLAVSIKKLRPGAEVTATDISGDALALARENAEALNARVRFLRGDLFAPVGDESFDVIVSNPPYIPSGLRGTLQPEVEKEPPLSLFAGEDGLKFYRRIAREAPLHLAEGGFLCLETGDGESEAVAQLLRQDFDGIRILPDLGGLPRVVSARKKEGTKP